MYPDDESGSLWNSVQNGFAEARSNNGCEGIASLNNCRHLDQLKDMIFNSGNPETENETESILENYAGNEIGTTLIKTLIKHFL
jgi:hypothetical protein